MECENCKEEINKQVMYWAEPEFFDTIMQPVPFCNHFCNVIWYREQKKAQKNK